MTAPAPDDEPALDEQLAVAARRHARFPEDPDTCGWYGRLLLERANRDGDDASMTAGIARLDEAVRFGPEHPDRHQWQFLLGLARTALGRERGLGAEIDRGIGDLDAVLTWLAADDPGHPVRDHVVVTRMGACWDRYLLRRGTVDPGAHVDRLVAALDAPIGGGNALLAETAAVLRGLGRLERYEVLRERADLDAGIAILSDRARTLDPQVHDPTRVCRYLADAYAYRASLDANPADTDLGIALAAFALARTDEGELEWRLLQHCLASGLHDRFRAAGDLADLDRAIACRQALLADLETPWAAGGCGDLLYQRAELTLDPADITAAIELLTLATAEPDDDEPWMVWYELGRAYRMQWQITADAGSLARADQFLRRALKAGHTHAFGPLTVYIDRALVGIEVLLHDIATAVPDPKPGTVQLRALLSECDALVEDGAGLDDPLVAEAQGTLATLLGCIEFWITGYDLGSFDAERVRRRIGRGVRLPGVDPVWRAALEGLLAMVDEIDASQQGLRSTPSRLDLVARAASDPDLDQRARATFQKSLPLLLQLRSARVGDRRLGRAATTLTGRVSDNLPMPGPGEAAEFELMTLWSRMQEQLLHQDMAAFVANRDRVRELLADLPPAELARPGFLAMLQLVAQLPDVLGGAPISSPPGGADAPAGPFPPSGLLSGMAIMLRVMTLNMRCTRAMLVRDRAALVECAEEGAGIADGTLPDKMVLFAAVYATAFAWTGVLRCDPQDGTVAANAARWAGRAAEHAGGPHHPLWALICLMWGESLRSCGGQHRARSRQLGMSALSGHAWQVMLQSGTDFAMDAARAASADAAQVAAWCLQDRAGDDLLAVLDAGRGLVLWAGTASRRITEELLVRGHSELAAEWQDTAGTGRDSAHGGVLGAVIGDAEVPDDLRQRVLHAIGDGIVPGFDLHERVSSGEVQRALTRLGLDGLVYLMPANDWSFGAVVIVPAAGPIEVLPAPELTVGPGTVVSRWTSAVDVRHRARDLTVKHTARTDDVDLLDEVCAWAWAAAMQRLSAYVTRWELPRAARLTLVPMGALGLVPWHAAGPGDSAGGRRYALHDLCLSYGVSGRLLRGVAGHRPAPFREALVVGDPSGDLAFADSEARAIHAAFYPDGTYLDASDGTPERVLEWIAASAPGPSLLHFACHGQTDPARPADAYLLLAGGARLSARALLDASRLSALEISEVFLAACTTNNIGTSYDEAMSLATAFLAAGAQTVFGSLWPVPDSDTSLLMYMVHHFLRREGRPPAEALRAAQLWMLDPDRKPTPDMPARFVAASTDVRLARPSAWAGFTHLGR